MAYFLTTAILLQGPIHHQVDQPIKLIVWDNQVDHINGIRSDNKWSNLRHATQLENTRNRKKSSRNKSGVTGVIWDKSKEKWQARIGVCGKSITLGRFDDFDSAVISRKLAEVKYGFHKNHGRG